MIHFNRTGRHRQPVNSTSGSTGWSFFGVTRQTFGPLLRCFSGTNFGRLNVSILSCSLSRIGANRITRSCAVASSLALRLDGHELRPNQTPVPLVYIGNELRQASMSGSWCAFSLWPPCTSTRPGSNMREGVTGKRWRCRLRYLSV